MALYRLPSRNGNAALGQRQISTGKGSFLAASIVANVVLLMLLGFWSSRNVIPGQRGFGYDPSPHFHKTNCD